MDSIIKIRLLLFRLYKVALALVIVAFAFAERIVAGQAVSGTILSDTIWTAGAPIYVNQTITVAPNATLTIEPGAKVFFSSISQLRVEGTLNAQATRSRRILLTLSADTVGGNPQSATWGGIDFRDGSSGILRYCDIRYTFIGVNARRSSPELYHCRVEDFLLQGIALEHTGFSGRPKPIVSSCLVQQKADARLHSGIGISAAGSTDPIISGCEIANCRIGIQLSGGYYAPDFEIRDSEVRNNSLYGVYIHAAG